MDNINELWEKEVTSLAAQQIQLAEKVKEAKVQLTEVKKAYDAVALRLLEVSDMGAVDWYNEKHTGLFDGLEQEEEFSE